MVFAPASPVAIRRSASRSASVVPLKGQASAELNLVAGFAARAPPLMMLAAGLQARCLSSLSPLVDWDSSVSLSRDLRELAS